MKIAPSILSADITNLKADIELVKQAGAPYLHIDIMDGHFVDNITFGANVVKALRPHFEMVFDCHLMVDNPEAHLASFAQAGADIIGVHLEATPHIHRVISQIKALGKKAEVVLNPGTPVSAAKEILGLVDQVLVMTVDPGLGGQSFLHSSLSKIEELAIFKQENNLNYDIEVDGGINAQTAPLVLQAGANVLVAGSFIFDGVDPAKKVQLLNDLGKIK